ncbi:tyrosine-protein phosphatase [Labrys miyagiensis]|nr:tyrosine-protein phosphatase [Labrys miyagiensis]
MSYLTLTGAALGAVLLCAGSYAGSAYLRGNLHEVVASEAYRSAQLSDSQLSYYATAHVLKSIINLRGANPYAAWYKREIVAAKELGIAHYDFKMSANRLLPTDTADELIKRMHDAPKPLLIHCQAEADRSGLAAAIYLRRLHGADEEDAEDQLSIMYGHFGIPYLSGTYAMEVSWEQVEEKS